MLVFRVPSSHCLGFCSFLALSETESQGRGWDAGGGGGGGISQDGVVVVESSSWRQSSGAGGWRGEAGLLCEWDRKDFMTL